MGGTLELLGQIEALVRNARNQGAAYRPGSGRNNIQPKSVVKQLLTPETCVSYLTSQAASGRSGLPLAFTVIDCKAGKTLRVVPIMQVFRAKRVWSCGLLTGCALRFRFSSRFSCPTVFLQQHGSLAGLGVECWLRARQTARWDSRVDE